jgi:hypothetical protein
LARNDEIAQSPEPAFSLEDFESGKIAPNPDWLKEIWGKWPGDETIDELLAALDNIDKGDLRGDSEWRRTLTR